MTRIEKLLLNRYISFEPEIGEPFHDVWMGHADKPHLIRLAHAIVAQWLGSRMIVEPEELIVGRLGLSSIVTWSLLYRHTGFPLCCTASTRQADSTRTWDNGSKMT